MEDDEYQEMPPPYGEHGGCTIVADPPQPPPPPHPRPEENEPAPAEPLPVQPLFWSTSPATYFRQGNDEPTPANVIVAQIEPCWFVFLVKNEDGAVMYEKQLGEMENLAYETEFQTDRHILKWSLATPDGEKRYELILTNAEAANAFLRTYQVAADKLLEHQARGASSVRHIHELLDNLVAYN